MRVTHSNTPPTSHDPFDKSAKKFSVETSAAEGRGAPPGTVLDDLTDNGHKALCPSSRHV